MSNRRPHEIGLLGGAFDPVHNGHLEMARAAMKECGLDRVIFIPASISPFKSSAPRTAARDRLAMLRRALADQPGCAVSGIELARGGVSYTVETVRQIQGEHGPDASLSLIIGMDNLLQIAGWKEIELLIGLCRFIIIARPGCETSRLSGKNKYWAERIIARDRGRILPLSIPISSSAVRGAVREGRDLTGLVPPAVAGYIKEKGLYL
ncbi:MAG: nicotinate-nucleotide adenylyltransferase [PVC group bacterium]